MRTNEEIMNYLDKLKSEQNLSISEIARRVGLAKSGVSKYFNRTREFPINRVEDFAKAFHVSPENILGLDTKSSILSIYSQLETSRQNKVYDYAKQQLNEQNDVNNSITGYIRSTDEQEEKSDEKHVDLTDDDAVFTYEGRKIPEEDLEMIKRFMRGKE